MKNYDELESMTRALARVEPGRTGGRPSDAGARTLLATITAEPPGDPDPARANSGSLVRRLGLRLGRYGPRRLGLSLAAVAALVAGIVVGPGLLGGPGAATSYASSDIDIRKEGDEYVARIKNPYADHQKYREGFRSLGLDVDVRVVPASPSHVGQELTGLQGGQRASGKERTSASGMVNADGKSCTVRERGCQLVLRVPADLEGAAFIRLGRQAAPGEAYDEFGRRTATLKGRLLDGYRVDEKTVGEVVPEIRKRGLKISYLVMSVAPSNPGGFGIDPDRQNIPVGADWVVWEAEETASDAVQLLVTDKRFDRNPVYGGPRDNVIRE